VCRKADAARCGVGRSSKRIAQADLWRQTEHAHLADFADLHLVRSSELEASAADVEADRAGGIVLTLA
jgi:hypothetical protein